MKIYDRHALNRGAAVTPVTDVNGSDVMATLVVPVGADGLPAVARENLALVTNNTVAAPQSAYGGDYTISASASAWGGASAQVQYLGPDGATYFDLGRPRTANDVNDPANANAPQLVGLSSNARIRCVVTGAPTGLYLSVSRLPA